MKNMKNNTLISNWEDVQTEVSTLSKWMALYDAVNIISDKAKEKGMKGERVVYRPKAIKNFIKSTEDIYFKKILRESYNIDICYDESTSDVKETY
jgi:hypothetical protein